MQRMGWTCVQLRDSAQALARQSGCLVSGHGSCADHDQMVAIGDTERGRIGASRDKTRIGHLGIAAGVGSGTRRTGATGR